MKVIFLDFNGVLDTSEKMDIVDMDNLRILREIVDRMNAKIVISSSIKNAYYYAGKHSKIMNYLLETLINYGVEIYGITPRKETREEEIQEYLLKHKEIDDYLIIDDDYFFESMKEHMVKLIPQECGGNGLKGMKKKELKRVLEYTKNNIGD